MMRYAMWAGRDAKPPSKLDGPQDDQFGFLFLGILNYRVEISLPYVIAQTGGSMVVPLSMATCCKASVII